MLCNYLSLAGGSLFSFTPSASQWKTQIFHTDMTDEGHKALTVLLHGVVIPWCSKHVPGVT